MSIIDVLARLIGDGPWTQPQAIRNACAVEAEVAHVCGIPWVVG